MRQLLSAAAVAAIFALPVPLIVLQAADSHSQASSPQLWCGGQQSLQRITILAMMHPPSEAS